MYFRVLGRRGRADAANLAARQRRLEDVRGVERPFGRARAHQRVQLVDEHDDVRVLGQLLHDRLEALFELAAILRARDNKRDIQRQNALVGEEVRDVAVDDLLRQALDDRGLADPRLANEDGVVLRAAAEDLLYALQLNVPPDQRIELIFHGRFGQVPRELGQQRRLLHPGEGGLFVEQRNDVLADRVEPHTLLHQDGRRHGAFLAEDAQEQVLGPDVVVQQTIGFFSRVLEDALGFSAEGNFYGGGDFLAKDRSPLDFLPDAFQGEVRPRENPAGQSLAFPYEAQQQMLGFYRDAA